MVSRQVGCPKELAQKYDSDGIDEIYLQDTTELCMALK